jgi:hypothetical protein
MFAFHNDPPSLPAAANSTFVDCGSISAYLRADDCRVDVTISVGGFVEYPRECAIRMIRVVVENGVLVTEYPSGHFLDVSSMGRNITFCNVHQITGPTRTTVYCGDESLVSVEHIAKGHENAATGWTRAFLSTNEIVQLCDFCMVNSIVLFISRGRLSAPWLRVAHDYELPIEIPDKRATWLSHAPFYRWPVIFVSATPTELWRQLTDVYYPVWEMITGGRYDPAKVAVFMRPQEQLHLVKGVERFVEISAPPERACFSLGVFPRVPGSVLVGSADAISLSEHLMWIAANERSVRAFGDNLTDGETVVPSSILLDRRGAFLIQAISRQFPQAKVRLLPDSDDIEVGARAVARAHVFVACDISATIFGMFSRTVVVEIQPNGLECTRFGKLWAIAGGAKYIPAFRAKACTCAARNYSCYLQMTPSWENLDETAVMRAIAKALNETERD